VILSFDDSNSGVFIRCDSPGEMLSSSRVSATFCEPMVAVEREFWTFMYKNYIKGYLLVEGSVDLLAWIEIPLHKSCRLA